jgi:hypothetical protein
VLLTNVVVRAVAFHCTTAPFTKFVPVTVRVKAGPPFVAPAGEIEVIAGTVLPLKIVNTWAFEVPPPGEGFVTVI